MWQRPRVEETVKVRENKRLNSLVDLYKKPVVIRIKCQIIENAAVSIKYSIQMKNWERT